MDADEFRKTVAEILELPPGQDSHEDCIRWLRREVEDHCEALAIVYLKGRLSRGDEVRALVKERDEAKAIASPLRARCDRLIADATHHARELNGEDAP